MSTGSGVFLGIFEGHADPALAAVRNGKVIAYSEEERHVRDKHAYGRYPVRALRYCLDAAGVEIDEVEAVALNWDVAAYTDGTMEAFFERLRAEWPVDPTSVAWQRSIVRRFDAQRLRAYHERHWRREFGDRAFPRLHPVAHHYTHAFHAAMESPFDDAVCVTVDGSGDHHTTVVWLKQGNRIEPIREITMPHSLGWFYAAFTEYLGFDAYDGEYKVMGLAAYGDPEPDLAARIERVLCAAPDGIEFRLDPSFIHYGPHTWSERFTDHLVALLERSPRRPDEDITQWHENLAFAVQAALERAVERLVRWAVRTTGLTKVCIGGGVGHNVKLNSTLFELPEVDDVFAQPLCSDGGAAAGAALAACFQETGVPPARLETLALGHLESNESVERALRTAHVEFERPLDLCDTVARELAAGRVVGWFQGRMEAGPRALGQRSILVDPRSSASRDNVNAVVKFREYWRPFCPSIVAEAADDYFAHWTDAPFMTIAFHANDRLLREAPAVVHIDGSCRVQFVHERVLPRYHRLLSAFGRITGVPAVLNTSFNVKGEPIVCTAQDALRTFWSTGLEVLAIEDFIVRKPGLLR